MIWGQEWSRHVEEVVDYVPFLLVLGHHLGLLRLPRMPEYLNHKLCGKSVRFLWALLEVPASVLGLCSWVCWRLEAEACCKGFRHCGCFS